MRTMLQNLKLREIFDPIKVCNYNTKNKIMERVCAASTSVYSRHFSAFISFLNESDPSSFPSEKYRNMEQRIPR